jgi:hypothetical protein
MVAVRQHNGEAKALIEVQNFFTIQREIEKDNAWICTG